MLKMANNYYQISGFIVFTVSENNVKYPPITFLVYKIQMVAHQPVYRPQFYVK